MSSSFQFEAIVFLEWRHGGGLVTYSGLEPDCFQTRSLCGAVYDAWRSERLPVGRGVAGRFEEALRPTELVKEIELALKRGNREEIAESSYSDLKSDFDRMRRDLNKSNTLHIGYMVIGNKVKSAIWSMFGWSYLLLDIL